MCFSLGNDILISQSVVRLGPKLLAEEPMDETQTLVTNIVFIDFSCDLERWVFGEYLVSRLDHNCGDLQTGERQIEQ